MTAFLFIPLLAATWICGFILILFAAHYFVTVLESAAAGSETVIWQEEPFVDWIWKGFYLAWIAGFWLVPMIVVSRLASAHLVVRTAALACGLWLLLPIGILSSQTAQSPWIPFWPGLLSRLVKRSKIAVGFYLLDLPIVLLWSIIFVSVTMRENKSILFVIVLSPIAAMLLFMHAWLIGRLGLVLSFTRGSSAGPKKRKRKKIVSPTPATGNHSEQPIHLQPSELPPIATPFEGEITGYNIQYDPQPVIRNPPTPAPVPASGTEHEDTESFAMSAAEELPEADDRSHQLPVPSKDELALMSEDRRVRAPNIAFNSSLWTIFREPNTLKAIFILSLGFACFAIMIQMLAQLRPTN